MEPDLLDEVIRISESAGVGFIQVNAHGETTMVPGWHHRVNDLAAAGIELQIITNFARLLSSEELAAMARIQRITISIDTHRPEVLRRVRRSVSLGNILINMANTALKRPNLACRGPKFIWCSVITDKVALDFVDYLRFGMALGVKIFLSPISQSTMILPVPKTANHVTTLPDAELISFAEMLDEGSAMVQAADGYIDISAGLVDTVRQELAVRGANELQILRGTADSGQIHPRLPRPMVHDLRIGRPDRQTLLPAWSGRRLVRRHDADRHSQRPRDARVAPQPAGG